MIESATCNPRCQPSHSSSGSKRTVNPRPANCGAGAKTSR